MGPRINGPTTIVMNNFITLYCRQDDNDDLGCLSISLFVARSEGVHRAVKSAPGYIQCILFITIFIERSHRSALSPPRSERSLQSAFGKRCRNSIIIRCCDVIALGLSQAPKQPIFPLYLSLTTKSPWRDVISLPPKMNN